MTTRRLFLLLFALAAAAPAGAEEAAPAPSAAHSAPRRVDVRAFEWQVGVDPIVLGETESVPLTLTATLPDGAPLDVAPPTLRASTGSLSLPRREGPGRWSATFTPPKERFPHVAILSAQVDRAEDSVVGFVAVPLWGKGRLQVKTKPDSDVVIFLGNRSFGPAKADKRGRAFVDILAPPGPERAVAKSKDPAGNESQKGVDLGVPPFNRLALVALDEVAAADGDGEAQLLVFAVDKKGEPLFDAVLTVEASQGSFEGAPLALFPGVYRVRYRPGLAEVGTASIKVSLAGSQASVAETRVSLLSGRPVRADLKASRSLLTADDDSPVEVTARFFDQAGNAVPAEGARLDVSYGRIDEKVRIAGGQRVVWVLPRRVPPAPPTLTARATTGEVLGSLTIDLQRGRPARLVIDPVAAVVGDGQSSSTVVVRAADRAGNPVLPKDVVLRFGDGAVVGLSAAGEVMEAQLVPEVRDQETISRVAAVLGPLVAERPVRVLPRPRARLLVGVGAVSSWNYGALWSFGPEASFLVRLPGFDGGVHAGLSLGALWALPSAPSSADGHTLQRQHLAYPLHLEGGWRPLLTKSLSLHLGAAVGMTVSDLELKGEGSRAPQRSITPAASAQGVVGVAWRLGPGHLEADLKAGYAVPLGGELVGTPLGVGLVLGYRFGL